MPVITYGFYAQNDATPYRPAGVETGSWNDLSSTPDGNMVVVYYALNTTDPANPSYTIFLRKIGDNGLLIGDEIVVATNVGVQVGVQSPGFVHEPFPSVAVAADGRIAVVWTGIEGDASVLSLQVLNPDLTLYGPQRPVPVPAPLTPSNTTVRTEIAATANGDFDIIVVSAGPTLGIGPTLHRIRMDADSGAVLESVPWTGLAFSQFGYDIATLADGRPAIVASHNVAERQDELYTFAPQTVAARGESRLFIEDDPQIVPLRDGGYAIAWRTSRYGASDDISFRIFNADGTARTGIVQANAGAGAGSQSLPAITELPNGMLVVAWTHGSIPSQIVAAAFDSNGVRVANPTSIGIGHLPNLVTLGDGTIGFEWGNYNVPRGEFRLVDLVREWTGNTTAESFLGDGMRDAVIADAGNDTINTLGGDDAALGGAGNDNVDGGDGDDLLSGDEGDDVVRGGNGNDTMGGGQGIDTASYAGATAGVTVVLAYTGPQPTIGAGVDDLSGFENLGGSAFADALIGDEGANHISGVAGDDWLVGSGGDDVLEGGADINVLIGGDGVDLASYASQTANLWVDMTAGVYSAAGVWDVFFQSIEGVLGGSGNDTIFGNGLDNTLRGGSGDDALIGGVGADRLEGGTGADWIVGGEGNDRLIGGEGVDVLTGGAGVDTFDLGTAAGWDVAFDFNTAEDRFSLGGLSWLGFFTIDADGDGQADDTLLGYAGGNFVALNASGLSLTQWNALVDAPAGAASGKEMMADAEIAPHSAWIDPMSGVEPGLLPEADPGLSGVMLAASDIQTHETSGWGMIG